MLKKEPEGGYTVTVPSLPGCITYGETIDIAIDMAKEAIDLYIQELNELFVTLNQKAKNMTSTELKNIVISKINQVNDDDLLKDIYKILEENFDESEVYQLSGKHLEVIDLAKEQIKRGEYLTNKQSDKEIEEWLNK